MGGRREGWVYLLAFMGTIVAANWLVRHVGTTCAPGLCLVPVWPGVLAPSGVLAVGLGFTFRDLVQRRLGVAWSVAAVLGGALLTALLDPRLAVASGSAFLLSELLDLAVYTPLQRRHLTAAVLASNLAGLVVDSVVFLALAFGSLAFLPGQVIGKLWMTLLSVPVIQWIRAREAGDRLAGPAGG